MKVISISLKLSLLLLLITPLRGYDLDFSRDSRDPNLFQFVRIRYNGFSLGGWGGMRGQWVPPWMHDYPRAERNFLKILGELTTVETSSESYLVLDLSDPDIMNYPFLYVSEPGYWDVTEREVENLREYLNRGGFIVFDDFRGPAEWSSFAHCMRQVFPERHFEKLTLDHPVFHCFYDIETLEMIPPYDSGKPEFYGLTDEDGRLLAVANFNNDIGDYWEWSDESLVPVRLSNEAYKLGINYVIYAMTH
ncbi:MAG: DUF4159 domain-containing protein [Acidobacteriota bacterium]